MDISQFLQELSANLKETTALEYIGTICGIASVFYSRKENNYYYNLLLNISMQVYQILQAEVMAANIGWQVLQYTR